MRTQKEIEDAIVELKKTFDKSYLEDGLLRLSLHGAIMGLLFALGERELKEIVEDKTDDFIHMTITQQEVK